MTQSRAMTASTLPEAASAFAATGISKLPGTQATVMRPSSAPCRRSASSAPSSRERVTTSFHRLITMPNARPSAVSLPSSVLAGIGLPFPGGQSGQFAARQRFPFPCQILRAEYVPHLLSFRLEIFAVIRIGRNAQRDPLDDLQPVAFQSRDLHGVVGHKPDLLETQIDHDLRADAIIPQIGLKAEHLVGLHGIGALLLQLIGAQLIDQADAAPLLLQIDQHAAPLIGDHLQRQVQLAAAVALERVEQIASD